MAGDPEEQALRIIRNRRDTLLRERVELRKRRVEIAQRDRAIDRELADCVAAARVFGEVLELPEDEHEQGRLFAGRPVESHPARTYRRLIDLGPDRPADRQESQPKPAMPKIKDIVLDRLKAAGDEGTKAAPIRDYITETYGHQIHEKTVGMTLYRLSKEGLSHREGITWFFGPSEAETKNPGVGAPGSTSSS